jgi:nitronate monooxygenase
MPLTTAFTDLVSVQHPIALAPMGGSAGEALAAAVSNGGGLGLLGGRPRDPRTSAGAPAGRGDAVVRRPWPVRRADPKAGALLIVQVTDVNEAQRALDVGADVIVAQGTEAGGHGGRRATLPLVPIVVDLAAPVPVLAAGGIADGRGLAAALVLGAAGALVGTRFQASLEALVPAAVSKALLGARGSDTERSRVLDIARDGAWPDRYTARTLRNRFLDQWRDREDALRNDNAAKQAYRDAVSRDDLDVIPVWVSEAVDLVTDVQPAGDLVNALVADAGQAIIRAGNARRP